MPVVEKMRTSRRRARFISVERYTTEYKEKGQKETSNQRKSQCLSSLSYH